MVYVYLDEDDKQTFIKHLSKSLDGLKCFKYIDNVFEKPEIVFDEDELLIYDFGIKIPNSVLCKKLCVCHKTKIGEHIVLNGLEDLETVTFPKKELDYKCEDYIVATSNLIRNELIIFYGIDDKKIIVLDYGIEVECIEENDYSDSTIFLNSRPIVGFFNLFNGNKDIISFLQKMLPNIEFVELKNKDSIQNIDLYLHLPVYQGSDYHYLYAMASGVPIITTQVGIFSYPIIRFPKLITVINSDYKIQDVYEAIENVIAKLKKLKLSDIYTLIRFTEDHYSLEGFAEEWKMCVLSIKECGDFTKYIRWVKGK